MRAVVEAEHQHGVVVPTCDQAEKVREALVIRLRNSRRRGRRACQACGRNGDPGGRKAESHARVAHRLNVTPGTRNRNAASCPTPLSRRRAPPSLASSAGRASAAARLDPGDAGRCGRGPRHARARLSPHGHAARPGARVPRARPAGRVRPRVARARRARTAGAQPQPLLGAVGRAARTARVHVPGAHRAPRAHGAAALPADLADVPPRARAPAPGRGRLRAARAPRHRHAARPASTPRPATRRRLAAARRFSTARGAPGVACPSGGPRPARGRTEETR